MKSSDIQSSNININSCDMPFESNNITNYNPLHNEVGIKPEKLVSRYLEKLTYNKYVFEDIYGNKKVCFKKFITLVDYVKFLIGKYKPEDMEKLPSLENKNESKFETYINSYNNYAYVDGYFYYLTSKLLKLGFVHGLEYYDNYICIRNNCEINIADDFEYLADSNFFNENNNKLFKFKDPNFVKMYNSTVPLSISDENVELITESLDDLNLDNLNLKPECLDNEEDIKEEQYKNSLEDSSDDSDHSTVDLSDEEETNMNDDNLSINSNETEDWETEEEDQESFDNDEINDLTLIINKIPTQVVALECCDTTFDSILENNEIKIEELESAMFQVIAMLYMYQQVFKFTHNDLHTNNIMCINTTEEYLYYTILGKHYKIPTFGRIYKIIDFGRSIYSVNNVLLCSDSFSENGTANTQYNFKPFYNSNKPVIEPNYSFDLCRLACSMVDFIIDDMSELNKYRKQVPVYDLIISWLYDDNGVNILYKKNGEERYPDFKLYKMIARLVHNHTPEKQFDHYCFKKYVLSELETNKKYMNLDEIKNQVHL